MFPTEFKGSSDFKSAIGEFLLGILEPDETSQPEPGGLIEIGAASAR
jgi:hypothetical protein